ncbi:MAG: T9SS type A sorting domain-containing protein [Polaribacter sp.]|nr:T9SS type A sorting domain-containing protein [Polaribacter sp.]
MRKKILFAIATILTIGFVYMYASKESEVEKLRKQHATFLKNHPYNKTLALTKSERKAQGIPPNKYFEQEYLNEINPATGVTHKRELLKLQEQLNANRLAKKAPGDTDNAWEERGPDNIGGRTRALLFDPNDDSQETVYAGGVSGGLWKNTNISDINSAWSYVGISENLSVSSIAVDPNNTNIWYVGTGESYTGGDAVGNGLWKTIDGGATWNQVYGGVTGSSYVDTSPGAILTINSPANIAGDYNIIVAAAFGSPLSTAISGDLVLAIDGASPTDDACSTIENTSEMNGKIAVIKRGACSFDDKVKRAQDAGAIAVIVVNNVSGAAISMGGDGLGFEEEGNPLNITITSAMVNNIDGDAIIAALGSGVNGSLQPGSNTTGYTILPGIQHINDLVVRDNNGTSEVFFAAAETFASGALIGINEVGVYKSTDGTSFSKLTLSAGENLEPNNIKIAADNSIYVSTQSNSFGEGGGRIYQSTDGTTFTLKHTVPGGRRTEIACSQTDANTIYVLAQLSSDPVGIYKTTDNFTNVTTLPLPNDVDNGIPENDFTRGQAFYDLLLRVDPTNDDILYVGGIDLFKSINGGTSWDQISKWSNNNNLAALNVSSVHADQHGLAFSSSSKMLFSNDGGVYLSNDAGVTILPRKKGYNTLQFYTVGVAPTTAFSGKEYFLAGAQDNGTLIIQDAAAGVNGFVETFGGDGAYSFFDQDGTDQYYIANYVYNNAIVLFDLSNGTSREINSESSSNGDFINQEALDSNLDILYSNYSSGSNYIVRMYGNLKSGVVTKKSLAFASVMDAEPSALTVSPYTTNQSNLFIGLKNGKIIKITGTTNTFPNNPEWTDITGSNFVGSVSDIELGANENEIFVTMHNYGVNNIWYTNDGGTNWSEKEGDLPDMPVKAILQNPLRTEEVIIGTDLGVWRTSNFFAASPNWVQSYNGMSNVKVNDLDLRDDNTVFASTYGRGVFSGKFTAEVASVDDVLAGTKAFTIYPTISNGNFTLQAKSSAGKTNVNIFDISGRQVYKSNLDFAENEKHAVSLQVSSGIYIVNIMDENNNKSSKKIVIE